MRNPEDHEPRKAPQPYGAASELERKVPLDRLHGGAFETEVVARPGECAALAARLQVPAVAQLSCRFRLMPVVQGVVEAEAWLTARLTQVCVVTLEPFETSVSEHFRLRFVPDGQLRDDDDPEAVDELEYRGNAIDLGEAAVEQLALALDPYPRKLGAVPDAEIGQVDSAPAAPEDAEPGVEDEEQAAHPFAALATRLRPNG